jgi:hypothetical protein
MSAIVVVQEILNISTRGFLAVRTELFQESDYFKKSFPLVVETVFITG